MPVPLVSVRNCERKPISPRAGIRNSIRMRPLPWLTILVIVPRRMPTCAMTTPWNSSATSMTRSSTGSITWPLTSRVTMSGRETCSSNPSRRIISIRIDSCSSPRPSTFICSGVSVGSTLIDTLPSSSRSSRSLIWREVTNWPSRPDIGEVFTPKIIDTVGSSTAIGGIARGILGIGDGLADRDVLDARPGRRCPLRRPPRCRPVSAPRTRTAWSPWSAAPSHRACRPRPDRRPAPGR